MRNRDRFLKLALAALLAAMSATPVVGEQASDLEASIKANYLVRFAAFVQWPTSALQSASTFNVCVAGRDPLIAPLVEAARGERAHGRAIAVIRLRDAGQASRCHIIYVGQGGAGLLSRLPANAPVLRVTDDAWTTRPGMIHFHVLTSRVRFRIDNRAARAADLGISSRLLTLASSVQN
jgi:hypothetical protein